MADRNGSPVFLVLGATGGIGQALVRRLEAAGGRVAVASRDGERLAALDVAAEGGRFPCDATDFDQVDDVFRRLMDTCGRIDGAANCVGSLLLKPAHLTRHDDWTATIRTNLGSAFAVTRSAGRFMKDGGSVVLVSSAAARIGLSNHEAIAAAKAGIIGLTLSAAATYATRGLRFNAVAPGLVRTPMTERITSNETAAAASTALHALGRLGEPDDVARSIAWFLDPAQGWVTGQVLGVDGGLGSVRRGTS